MYIQRLKMKHSSWKERTGYGLFFSTYMIAAKFLHDNPYPTQAWVYIGGYMFTTEELCTYEKDILEQLKWDVAVDGQKLEEFTKLIQEQYSRSGFRPACTIIDTHAHLKDSVGDYLKAQGKDPIGNSFLPDSYTIASKPPSSRSSIPTPSRESRNSRSQVSHPQERTEWPARKNSYLVSGPLPW
jgi:hypothetical protein